MRMQLLSVMLCALGAVATAGPVQVDYTLNMGSGTLNGNDLTSLMIMETGSGLVNLDFPYTVAGAGASVLSHVAPFLPTTSLIVGLDLPSTTGGDNKTHLVFFTNNGFAMGANGVLFSVAFPNTHHNDFISRMLLAEAGDTTQLAWMTNFFLTGDGRAAAFATATQSTAIEFSLGAVPTPEPVSMGLVGLGLAALWVARRRRASAA
jgi:hypothetical protein